MDYTSVEIYRIDGGASPIINGAEMNDVHIILGNNELSDTFLTAETDEGMNLNKKPYKVLLNCLNCNFKTKRILDFAHIADYNTRTNIIVSLNNDNLPMKCPKCEAGLFCYVFGEKGGKQRFRCNKDKQTAKPQHRKGWMVYHMSTLSCSMPKQAIHTNGSPCTNHRFQESREEFK